MKVAYCILLVVGTAIASCAGPREEISTGLPAVVVQPATAPATTRPAEALPGVPLRVGARDILYLTGVTAHLPRKSVTHAILQQPLSTSTAAGEPGTEVVSSHALMPIQTGAPPMTCRIITHDGGRGVSVVIESKSKLPALSLTAVLPDNVYPARCGVSEGLEPTQLAIGPATRLVFDSLHDTTDGACYSFVGNVSFETEWPGYRLKAREEATGVRQRTLLRLDLQPAEKVQPPAKPPALSLARLAPPTPLAHARRYATEWAFAPTDQVPSIPSPTEALRVLSADRARLIACAYPQQPVRLVDRPGDPAVRNLVIAQPLTDPRESVKGQPPLQWNVLYLNNASATGRTESLSLREMGITPTAGCLFAVYDFWQEQLLAVTDDPLEVDLSADDCRVLCLRDIRPNEPGVISTNEHITQGLPDLTEVRYEPRSLTLSGRSSLTAGDPYELRILLPTAGQGLEIERIEAGAVASMVRADGPLRIVTLESTAKETVAWQVRFRKAPLTRAPPSPPARLAARQNTRGVLLTWDRGEDRPPRYRIYRDGKPLATVAGCENQYQDSDVLYNSQYTYTIRSADWAGRESSPLPPAVHRTPIPANAYLTQLVPLSIEYTHRPPATNRSARGKPLRMAGRRYNRGLGATTGTKVEYFLGKGYERFSGEVGVDDETAARGLARFEIRGDDRVLFRSEPLAVGQQPQRFDVSVRGCRRLSLSVVDADGGEGEIHADWGDTYLRAAPTPGR